MRFLEVARLLARATRRRGLLVPGFRCPPRLVGVARSLKRWDDGAQIAVVVKGRPWLVVLADMIEGVVVANRLVGGPADRLRAELWEEVGSLAPGGAVVPGLAVA